MLCARKAMKQDKTVIHNLNETLPDFQDVPIFLAVPRIRLLLRQGRNQITWKDKQVRMNVSIRSSMRWSDSQKQRITNVFQKISGMFCMCFTCELWRQSRVAIHQEQFQLPNRKPQFEPKKFIVKYIRNSRDQKKSKKKNQGLNCLLFINKSWWIIVKKFFWEEDFTFERISHMVIAALVAFSPSTASGQRMESG